MRQPAVNRYCEVGPRGGRPSSGYSGNEVSDSFVLSELNLIYQLRIFFIIASLYDIFLIPHLSSHRAVLAREIITKFVKKYNKKGLHKNEKPLKIRFQEDLYEKLFDFAGDWLDCGDY
jgi:hypothetical protein